MPTYTYRCKNCDYIYDKFHSMSETETKCPKCNEEVERLIKGGSVLSGDHSSSGISHGKHAFG